MKEKLKRMLELVEAGEDDFCSKCWNTCKRYRIIHWTSKSKDQGISSVDNLKFCSQWEEKDGKYV